MTTTSKSVASDVTFPCDVDVSKITFSAPKQLDNGGRSIFINYNNRNLIVQTPMMSLPFGISVWPGERGLPDKHTLQMSFAGRDTNQGVQDFFDMLERISEHVIDNALENSTAWFKKKYPSRDVVADMFTPSIRYSKDKDTGELSTMYPPNFKLNLPFVDGDFRFPVYGGDREPLDLNEILGSPKRGKGARVSAIIHLQSIRSVGLNKSFGVTWKVCQLRMIMPANLDGYAFMPTDDDLYLNENNVKKKNSDDDEEEEEEEQKEDNATKNGDEILFM
jgi:hypothetical protein